MKKRTLNQVFLSFCNPNAIRPPAKTQTQTKAIVGLMTLITKPKPFVDEAMAWLMLRSKKHPMMMPTIDKMMTASKGKRIFFMLNPPKNAIIVLLIEETIKRKQALRKRPNCLLIEA